MVSRTYFIKSRTANRNTAGGRTNFQRDAMSEPPNKEDDAAFADNADKIRGGLDARVQEAKLTLMEWAAEQTRPGNGGAITLAMLELGIERHLNIFPDEQSAADLVQGVLCKVLSRRRETMQ
jgi:hypothetical protein